MDLRCAYFRRDPTLYTVYLGRQTQNITANPNEVKCSVQSIMTHPDYENKPFDNDIALMKLSEPVTFTEYIRPACLPSNTSTFHNATTCWATGWVDYGGSIPFEQILNLKSYLCTSEILFVCQDFMKTFMVSMFVEFFKDMKLM